MTTNGTEAKFAALTGNERLDLIGKFDVFYDAVARKDARLMEDILREIQIGEGAIEIMFNRYSVERPKAM